VQKYRLIANRKELDKFHGCRSAQLILAALEAALASVEPSALVRRAVRFDGKELSVRDINGKTVRLSEFDRVYVVGAGKATARMSDALCSILKDRVAGGAITVPYAIKAKKMISVTEASHPVPDKAGVEGTERILKVLKKARHGDLVFVLLSGGGSALMPLPVPGISLRDKQRVTGSLLRSGASIQEMNAVRKHLSAIKGGQLLRHIHRSCTVVSLVLSDVIGDDLGVIASGPTFPDSSTFGDALKIIKKYRIARASDPAAKYIAKGAAGEVKDTPKQDDPVFISVHNMLIGSNLIACESAVDYLKGQGLGAVNLGSKFDGEAQDFGRFLVRLASDLVRTSLPFAVVAGGETTVRLGRSSNGTGGRNQEAALACAIELHDDVVVACMGTDGIDGNSDAAGALVSQKTALLAKKRKIDLRKHLARHDSYHALKKLNSLIFTGRTGTNVNDIAIICGGIPTTNDVSVKMIPIS
jgi:glycerate 2-kinase